MLSDITTPPIVKPPVAKTPIQISQRSGLLFSEEETLGSPPFIANPRSIAVLTLIGDVAVMYLLSEGIHMFRFGDSSSILDPFLWGIGLTLLLSLYISNLYRPHPHTSNAQIINRLLISGATTGITITFFSYLTRSWAVSPVFWRSFLLPFLLGFYAWVSVSRWLIFRSARLKAAKECYLVLSNSENGDQFENYLRKSNRYGSLITLSDEGIKENGTNVCATKFLDSLDNSDDIQVLDSLDVVLTSYMKSKSISGVVVDPQAELDAELCRKLMELRLKGLPVYDLKNYYQKFWYKFPPALLQDNWFTFGDGFNLVANRTGQKIKRLSDILISGLMLIVLLPLMVAAAIAIKLDSPGPIFYKQLRTGLKGRPLYICKFRSMVQDAEKHGAQWAQKKDSRITKVGYWLRLTRIDELPQLWNVLRGDMSLIGPRPERPQFDRDLEQRIPYYALRYLVKPGITGWAQVNYPYGASLEDAYEKLSYDLYYIKNYALWLDLFIVLKTARVVFMGKGR